MLKPHCIRKRKNDGVTDNALVLLLVPVLKKWGDAENIIGLHSISRAAMKPVNGNVIMSAEDILLQVSASKGLTATAPVVTPAEEPVDEMVEETQTLPEDVEAGEEPEQPVVTAAPAPGLDAGNFFGYLKSMVGSHCVSEIPERWWFF